MRNKEDDPNGECITKNFLGVHKEMFETINRHPQLKGQRGLCLKLLAITILIYQSTSQCYKKKRDLAKALDMNEEVVRRNLKTLRQMELIRIDEKGRYYIPIPYPHSHECQGRYENNGCKPKRKRDPF